MPLALGLLLLLGLQAPALLATSCPSSYTSFLGTCLHFPLSPKTWCGAQHYCTSKKGELIRGSSLLSLLGNTFGGMPGLFWVGLTDLLDERRGSKSGWRWSDGSLEPPLPSNRWQLFQPSSGGAKDCLYHCLLGKLCDSHCSAGLLPPIFPMCQPRPTPSTSARAVRFQTASIPSGLASVEFADANGCSQLLRGVATKFKCAILCASEPDGWCVSFYFHKAKQECRLVLFTDATINLGSENGWIKVVLKR